MSVHQTDRLRDLYAGWGPMGDYLSLALEDLCEAQGNGRAQLDWEDRQRLQRLADLMRSGIRGAQTRIEGRDGVRRARERARDLAAAEEGSGVDLPPFDADIAHFELLARVYPGDIGDIKTMVMELGNLSKLVEDLSKEGEIPRGSNMRLENMLIPMLVELAHVYDGAEEELPPRETAAITS